MLEKQEEQLESTSRTSMKKESLINRSVPTVRLDNSLEQFKEQSLFQDKVDKANKVLCLDIVFLAYYWPHEGKLKKQQLNIFCCSKENQDNFMKHYTEIITMDPNKRFGKPCIRGLRITVFDVLGWLASGMSVPEILDDFPELTDEDIKACLSYAADRERKLRIG